MAASMLQQAWIANTAPVGSLKRRQLKAEDRDELGDFSWHCDTR
jgi:hypothetical protein